MNRRNLFQRIAGGIIGAALGRKAPASTPDVRHIDAIAQVRVGDAVGCRRIAFPVPADGVWRRYAIPPDPEIIDLLTNPRPPSPAWDDEDDDPDTED